MPYLPRVGAVMNRAPAGHKNSACDQWTLQSECLKVYYTRNICEYVYASVDSCLEVVSLVTRLELCPMPTWVLVASVEDGIEQNTVCLVLRIRSCLFAGDGDSCPSGPVHPVSTSIR